MSNELNLLLIETEKSLLYVNEQLKIKNIRYLKLLNIVKRASNNSCCICCDECLSCDAQTLLKEIGEK